MAFGTLFINQPGRPEQMVSLTKPVYKIGSADDNDLVLPGDAIEPHHAELFVDDTTCEVLDLGSAGGTWLGPIRLYPRVREPVRDKTVIRVGNVELVYTTEVVALPPVQELVKQPGRRAARG